MKNKTEWHNELINYVPIQIFISKSFSISYAHQEILLFGKKSFFFFVIKNDLISPLGSIILSLEPRFVFNLVISIPLQKCQLISNFLRVPKPLIKFEGISFIYIRLKRISTAYFFYLFLFLFFPFWKSILRKNCSFKATHLCYFSSSPLLFTLMHFFFAQKMKSSFIIIRDCLFWLSFLTIFFLATFMLTNLPCWWLQI